MTSPPLSTMRPLPDGFSLHPCRFGDSLWDSVVALRLTVYVDEQKVPLELELDDLDVGASHLALRHQDETVGTLRIAWEEPGIAHIGRLAIDRRFRRQGLARLLLGCALDAAVARACNAAVLDAQVWITHLYASLGFAVCSEEFLDAGIPHLRMRRELKDLRCSHASHCAMVSTTRDN
jgi:predicted GNAT family N-acyltransferase